LFEKESTKEKQILGELLRRPKRPYGAYCLLCSTTWRSNSVYHCYYSAFFKHQRLSCYWISPIHSTTLLMRHYILGFLPSIFLLKSVKNNFADLFYR